MDLINNLVFTALHKVDPFDRITPKFFDLPAQLGGPLFTGTLQPPPEPDDHETFYSYKTGIIEKFCAFDDPEFLENAVQKHWSDMVGGRNYVTTDNKIATHFKDPAPGGKLMPPYHMVYAYLVENTRIAQIFEKLLFLYMHDEKLTKITPTTIQNRAAFQWIVNTENLFFKNLANNSLRNIVSQVRISADATRRNAYFRMLGMDLAFGDLNTNSPVSFYKGEFNNQPFIVLLEKLLSEIWQAYTNAKNQVGANTTDMFVIIDTARKIQEMLLARRTTETDFTNYQYWNLSKEEYASVVMMSWLYEVVSYNSPIVQFLRCNGNTPGERLINIGNKVGLPAHSKSEGLLDIAPPMNTLLRRIEFGHYNDENAVDKIIRSQALLLAPTDPSRIALNDLLLIINNWEKATGHRIKNPEANITGTVKVQQNGVKAQTAMN